MNDNFLNSYSINSIKDELKQYVEDNISNYDCLGQDWTNKTYEDLHNELFNSQYYLIGYNECEQWLKMHFVSAFDGIAFVQDYERENFGDDAVRTYDNSETLVNMITYIIGEEVVYEFLENLAKEKEKARIDAIAKDWIGRGFVWSLDSMKCNPCKL